MRPLLAALTVAATLSALPVGGHAGFFGGVATYGKDRFHDLLDIFRLRGGIPEDGKGLGVKAKVTSLAQVGYVHFNGRMYGMERRALGATYERRTEGGLSLLYGSLSEMEPLHGNSFLQANSGWSMIEDRRIIRNLPHWDDGRRRFLGIGAEIATPLFALDAGVYPEEAIDFVLGWVGMDIYDDDELWLHDTVSIPATEPRLLPDPLAPFSAKRQTLKDFDDAVTLQKALEEATPAPAAPTDEAAPAVGGERIPTKDADEVIRQIDSEIPAEPPPAVEEEDLEGIVEIKVEEEPGE